MLKVKFLCSLSVRPLSYLRIFIVLVWKWVLLYVCACVYVSARTMYGSIYFYRSVRGWANIHIKYGLWWKILILIDWISNISFNIASLGTWHTLNNQSMARAQHKRKHTHTLGFGSFVCLSASQLLASHHHRRRCCHLRCCRRRRRYIDKRVCCLADITRRKNCIYRLFTGY